MDSEFKLVEKEEVVNFNFPKEEVKLSDSEKKTLKAQLDRANTLGNAAHHKVKVYFEDAESKKVIYTTIWGVTESHILLKQNVFIPIQRIIKLEI
ncbi:MAG: hypothetical protein M9916_12325 [Crocinitomicaceae bacterium]|nr:hypothetical protein [Crocinitomicaceae bacterium]